MFRDTIDKPEPIQCRRCGCGMTTNDADGCDDCGAVLCTNCADEHDRDECPDVKETL